MQILQGDGHATDAAARTVAAVRESIQPTLASTTDRLHTGFTSDDTACWGLRVALWTALLLTVTVSPVLAQEAATNPVCADETNTLSNMIEGFVQITTGLGVMGLLVVWQADALLEMFTLGREQKAKIKQHKRGAVRSALTLVVLGPLFTVGGSAMQLPIASCVDLIPF